MAELERTQEHLRQSEMDARLYYDYEGRFIKQRLERDRLDLLPRVVKPAMFAKGGHALGDVRVFERLSVAPISSLTCSFLELEAGERTDPARRIPALVAYVIEGSGACIQDGEAHRFAADDVVVVPPYTTYQLVADPGHSVRAWLPEIRLWHVLGLLWQEQFAFSQVPEGTEPIPDGFRVPAGTLGLQRDLDMRAGANPRREAFFSARRAVTEVPPRRTRYDDFLQRLVDENEMEARAPRVIRGTVTPWEDTRQGRLKFYISNWTQSAARALDLMAYEVEPHGHSGRHRHIAEELLLVLSGTGHDLQEETRHAWEAGDLICIPPMTAHEHHNDGDQVARLISVWPRQLANEFLGGIEYISDASSWLPR